MLSSSGKVKPAQHASQLLPCDGRFVEGEEMDAVLSQLWQEWQGLQGDARDQARQHWLDAVREGVYQLMQVCCHAAVALASACDIILMCL